MFEAVIANIAVVALTLSLWVHAQQALESRQTRYRSTLFAIALGLGAAATVILPIDVLQGQGHFDLRIVLVALVALFSEPLVAIVAGAIAASMQVSIDVLSPWPGMFAIVASIVVGQFFYFRLRRGTYPRIERLIFAALIGLVNATSFLALPGLLLDEGTAAIFMLVTLLTAGAALIGSEVLIAGKRFATERHLLQAAVTQAPDYFFIKDMRQRYVAVNTAVARIFGFSSPQHMAGTRDSDLVSAQRLAEIDQAEAELIGSGLSLHEVEEQIRLPDGRELTISTSRSSLRDADGEIIGIAGVTRDITDRRRREAEAERDHNLVTFALSEMSDGLAMFDRAGVLVLCNPRFSELFPRTGQMRRPGAHIRDILQAIVDTGEQLGIPADPAGSRAWVEGRAAELHRESDVEVNLYDGRWLQIRSRPTRDGSALIVVSDITAVKASTLALQGMTDQLKELATTDGLTGLLNRRSFDQMLVNELSRTGREQQPLTLLMIDVDRFKAYNDHYGHQAGDNCLRLVADSLRQAALRPGDSLARYGGEEFAAVLPNTDEDGAYVIAERLRKALRGLGLPHAGSEKGVITVSVGIASYSGATFDRDEAELIRRADQALYDAKAAGRDRVTGWRGTEDVVPRERYETSRHASR